MNTKIIFRWFLSPITVSPRLAKLYRKMLRGFAIASSSLFVASCVTEGQKPPPAGYAVIDANPAKKHRNQIDGIQLVAVNGRPVRATRSPIKPGFNTIRTSFRWPQGTVQKADLRFHATAGTLYFINSDVFPPRKRYETVSEEALDSISNGEPNDLSPILFTVPAAAGAAVEKAFNRVGPDRHSAIHIDLSVVAHHSSQGTVRRIRTYPDGRVDEKPWAPWAQIKAP